MIEQQITLAESGSIRSVNCEFKVTDENEQHRIDQKHSLKGFKPKCNVSLQFIGDQPVSKPTLLNGHQFHFVPLSRLD